MPTRSLIGCLATLLTAFALLGGCGGNDDGGGDGDASSGGQVEKATKARFIKEADAACTEHDKQIQREVVPYLRKAQSGSQTKVANEIVNEMLAPRLTSEILTVRNLVLPPEDVDEALRFLASMEEVLERAKEDPLAFVRASQPFAKPQRLAKRFGFKVCGGLSS